MLAEGHSRVTLVTLGMPMVVVRGVMVILVVGNDGAVGGTRVPVGVLMIKVGCWW